MIGRHRLDGSPPGLESAGILNNLTALSFLGVPRNMPQDRFRPKPCFNTMIIRCDLPRVRANWEPLRFLGADYFRYPRICRTAKANIVRFFLPA